MKEIQRYVIDREQGDLIESAGGNVCEWSDVAVLLAQFPEGMKRCTFELLECAKGHRRLTATNWIDHGCPTCAKEKLQEELTDMRAKAVAAVWLAQPDTSMENLRALREEAREVFMGKDKQTIAKLQDELCRAQTAYTNVQRPLRPAIAAVYGFRLNDKDNLRYALPIIRANYDQIQGFEVEVQLP
jgi:hypothetical protein